MTRNPNKAIVAGVSAGLAEDLDWPVEMIRLFFVVTFFLFGLGFFLYLFAWAFSPKSNPNQLNLGM